MANTASLGFIWKPKAWGDGEPVPRLTLPDGTIAEAIAGLGYQWNGSSWVRIVGDETNGTKVSVTGTPTVSVTGTAATSSIQGTFDEILQEMKKQTLQLGLLLAQFSGMSEYDLEGLTN